MRANESVMAKLHGLVAKAMTKELEDAMANELPVSPQMFSAIGKFLKDNEITTNLESSATATELSDEFTRYREERRERRKQRQVAAIPTVDEKFAL